MMRTTGFPAAIVANMLASGVINVPGAYPVEIGVPAEAFLRRQKRGFKLTDSFRFLVFNKWCQTLRMPLWLV